MLLGNGLGGDTAGGMDTDESGDLLSELIGGTVFSTVVTPGKLFVGGGVCTVDVASVGGEETGGSDVFVTTPIPELEVTTEGSGGVAAPNGLFFTLSSGITYLYFKPCLYGK